LRTVGTERLISGSRLGALGGASLRLKMSDQKVTACTAFNGKTLYDDAGVSDGAGALDGPSGCGCAHAGGIVCEDFEAPSPSATWQPFGTPPVRDTSQRHCGQASLHVRTPAFAANDTTFAGLLETQTFSDGTLAGGFYARAWVYVPSASTIATGNYFSLLETRQDTDPFLGVAAQIHASRSTISDWTVTPAAGAETTAPFPRDAWTCVEWQVTYGATNGSSTLWIGGAPAAVLSGTNTQPTPAYGAFLLGIYFQSESAQPAFDIWIDDVVLDAHQIGCAR
jgi:hypothetical protein